MIKALLVGDHSDSVIAHQAIPRALKLAAEKIGCQVETQWLPTGKITSVRVVAECNANAIWCVPGSPYVSMEGTLIAIRFARENKIPFLGTCGGFQHALIEYARNVIGISDADHAESNPEAATPIISKLSCALINRSEKIRVNPETRLAGIYGRWTIEEEYQCSYGVNPTLQGRLEGGPLKFTAFSDELGVRAFELADHPFYFGTLFQPERSAAMGKAHSLICALLEASRPSQK